MSVFWALIGGFAFAGDGTGLVDQPPAELRLPAGPQPAFPNAIPIEGPFHLVSVVDGVRSYEAPLPVRPRVLFFQSAPEGMKLLHLGISLKYGAMLEDRGTADTWEFSADGIIVRVAPDAPRPFPEQFRLMFHQATERQADLYPTPDQSADPTWAIRSAQVDDVSRRGIYLPAPSQVAWTVDVPERGVLSFGAGILPPEIDEGDRSDGANLMIWVDQKPLTQLRLVPGPFEDHRIDLSAYAGKTIRVELRTADAAPELDNVFVSEPQLYTPSAAPRRLLLVFVDTLRRDHLGTYGYERAPTPGLDRLASDSVVFDDARSVAPWTLPATRAALTGQQPELWEGAQTIAERLSARGWATGAYVGNVYLSSNFDMARGWGEHGCVNWPPADFQVDRGIEFLDRHPDQDALLMVHFMDLHLPYKEPFWYSRIYAGDAPADIGSFFTRTMLLRVPQSLRVQLRQYLIDRYDQNLRYVDDALQRLFAAAGPDATVAFFADHGEEFFDHGDLEHGHTLYDELVRIPMFLHAPSLPARRVTDPVSLLDLTPTLLDLLQVPTTELPGRSLLPLARGEASADGAHRPIAFGRPLYGETAWGSVLDGTKYVSKEGAEKLYDLRTDPGEQQPFEGDGKAILASREALAAGVGHPVRLALRITPSGHSSVSTPVEVRVPGGIEDAWVGDDPTQKSEAEIRRPDDETLIASFTGAYGVQREVFVIPRRPMAEVTHEVTIRMNRPGSQAVSLEFAPPGSEPLVLGRISTGGRGYQVTWAVLPTPFGNGTVAADAEMNAALQAIGYQQNDRAPANP